MRFHLEIDLDNAAFDEWPEAELGRILRELGAKVTDCEPGGLEGIYPQTVRDYNGRTVGGWEVIR